MDCVGGRGASVLPVRLWSATPLKPPRSTHLRADAGAIVTTHIGKRRADDRPTAIELIAAAGNEVARRPERLQCGRDREFGQP
jgi:hypothetical protein